MTNFQLFIRFYISFTESLQESGTCVIYDHKCMII